MPFDEQRQREFLAAHDTLARRGLRVLAVAQRDVADIRRQGNGWRATEVECNLELLGLVAMEDPPRRMSPRPWPPATRPESAR